MGVANASVQSEVVDGGSNLPQIYEARLADRGGVRRIKPPITRQRAVEIRKNDGDVVVCGPDKKANSELARDIEQGASGNWRRCKNHPNAGPHSLPHYQPDPRGKTKWHTFYETDSKRAL